MENEDAKVFKIAILDDEPMWRDAIVSLLKREPSLSVVGAVANQTRAVDLAIRYAPDVFLVDMKLKHSWQNGISATIAILDESPSTKVIILTSSEAENEVVEAVSAGAVNYISKSNCEDLLPMILQQLRGGFSPSVILAKEVTKLRKECATFSLTEQERNIVEEITKNVPRAKLATAMNKSESTIKSQISSILKKLEVSNTSEVIEKIKHGGVFFPQQKK